MGDIIPKLVSNGFQPRVMLEYSGCLLWGLRQMEGNDGFDNLSRITCDPEYSKYVELYRFGSIWLNIKEGAKISNNASFMAA